ncbi:unnamed protein product, partial [Choristocarpus tenellus]
MSSCSNNGYEGELVLKFVVAGWKGLDKRGYILCYLLFDVKRGCQLLVGGGEGMGGASKGFCIVWKFSYLKMIAYFIAVSRPVLIELVPNFVRRIAYSLDNIFEVKQHYSVTFLNECIPAVLITYMYVV